MRVILNGVGAVGCAAGRIIVERPYLEIVGAVGRTRHVGEDLGEVLGLNRQLGVKVSQSLGSVIADTKADIVHDATSSFLGEIQKDLFDSIKAGLNFVSSCEELGYPVATQPDLAHQIDDLAKSHSVTVLGTGTNPGFIQDLVPLFFTGACRKVKSITETRLNECSQISAHALKQFAIGGTREEFDRQVAEGTLVAHTGHPEQIMMIADAMGWKISNIKRTLRGIVSKIRREGRFLTVEPGRMCNVQTVTTGYRENGEKAITLDFTMLVEPDAEAIAEDAENGLKQGDVLTIEGTPNIEVNITGLAEAVQVTAARTVNAIPYVIQARPGLLSGKDFPPFAPMERLEVD